MRHTNLSSTVSSLLSITALCTMFLVASSNACAKTLYLSPGVWETGNPKYAIYYYGGGSDGWSDYMTSVSEDVYMASIPDGHDNVIFCRMNPNAGKNWDGRWDQTNDLTIPTDGRDMYVISAFGVNTNICPGEWSTYDSSNPGGGTDPVTPTDYESAVPNQCTDVMLQAFYWNSNSDNTYGNSQWSTLKGQATEITSYFDLVWLPPSCSSNDQMGYLPKEYHNQNSKMGQRSTLKQLISALHAGGTRVLADVVINHAANKGSWTDFMEQDFGEYGMFTPTSSWITSDDEARDKGYSVGSNPDDGQESNRNYGSARDWDHKNSNVQEMCRAYLKFLKNTMGYDGFRFDYCGGYHVSHVDDYVSKAKPYFSVMEYWNGDPNVLKTRIDNANKNTLTFDFASFYTCYQQGIASNNYDKLKNAGMRGKGYSKYAVNFVDNHDTFNRNDIGNSDCGNSKDGRTSLANRALILQCNAYMLSMPGVPCVFWPHWYKYKSEIKAMIAARKKAGIHSESTVEESSGSGWYKATITGKNGYVVLYLGSAASDAAPAGYTQVIKESKVAMYYTSSGSTWAVEQVNATPKSEKFFQDGQLFIRCGEVVYDAQGHKIN